VKRLHGLRWSTLKRQPCAPFHFVTLIVAFVRLSADQGPSRHWSSTQLQLLLQFCPASKSEHPR